jgi:transglutaminase-like putative cysteine protease
MKTIQEEKDLNRFLYNGSLTAVLFLEDVRKGDVIEYSYTIKGFNPIFKGRYSGVFDLDFETPVGSIYYKLVVPKDRQLIIKNNNSNIRPVTRSDLSSTTYEWRLDQVRAVRSQDDLPSWYDPYSIVMVSEYRSWKEVNDWAMELFPAVNDISPSLRKKIDDIAKESTNPEQQVSDALRFVQDDIRYMGVEMGENSHKPGHPNKTFAQRFRDCKDKSYLLCTMLNKLGIQASPVLINTYDKKTLKQKLPSALAFDHVTVLVTINNRGYWLDPTISFQRGGLKTISYPDYQCGLVIGPGNDSLTAIPSKEQGMTRVREVFDIPDMKGSATLAVTTQFTGGFADDVRNSFNNNSRYEMQKTYRDYYASYFDQLNVDSIDYIDDEKTGMFTTKEYYSINELWKLKEGAKKAEFDPYVIDGVIKRPKDTKRTMPFALDWPEKVVEDIEINLPEDWNAEQSFTTVKNPSLSMSARFSFDGRQTINLEYKYENLKDHVAPADMADYLKGMSRKDKEFSYELSYSEKSNGVTTAGEKRKTSDKNYIVLGLVILLVVGGIIWWTQRR